MCELCARVRAVRTTHASAVSLRCERAADVCVCVTLCGAPQTHIHTHIYTYEQNHTTHTRADGLPTIILRTMHIRVAPQWCGLCGTSVHARTRSRTPHTRARLGENIYGVRCVVAGRRSGGGLSPVTAAAAGVLGVGVRD